MQSVCTCVDNCNSAEPPSETVLLLPSFLLAEPPPMFCTVMSSSMASPTSPLLQVAPESPHQVQCHKRMSHFKSPMSTDHESLFIPTAPLAAMSCVSTPKLPMLEMVDSNEIFAAPTEPIPRPPGGSRK